MFERFRERRRLLQTYDVFVHYGTDFVFNRGAVGAFRRRMQQLLHRPPYRLVPLEPAVKVRLMLQELGPTYVKMGQIVSSQSSVLPTAWARELTKLQSDVKPFSIDAATQVIEEELGRPPEELFDRLDPVPLAAASLAQVHRATLPDGREVVVKVRVPTSSAACARTSASSCARGRCSSAARSGPARWACEACSTSSGRT